MGQPFASLTSDELARFDAGKDEFMAVETPDEGLGPVFNEASCATCHTNPVGGTNGRLETRFGSLNHGVFDPLANLGGSLLQDHGIGAVTVNGAYTYDPETVPTIANVVARRITTPLFGLGLVDAVPDAELIQLARHEAAITPGTAGRVSMVTEIKTGQMRVGRFGFKAQVPTLHQFSGDAYLNEMGVTSPEFPNENCPQGDCSALAHNPMPTMNDDGSSITAFEDFMKMLAPPPRGALSPQVVAGSGVFALIGCGSCHTRALVTGGSPIAALSNKVFEPFSDFLVHDMGSLGDGIVQNTVQGREIRTTPLWGVGTRPMYLHDGRAATIDDAIRAHDGQGRAARNRYVGLSSQARQSLLAFLNTI
jgi:CxxC motif-containing protein (DUF1111 family)